MNVKKIAQFAIGTLGTAAIGFVMLPILSWYLPQEDVGRYSLLQTIISFSTLALCLGLDQAFVREFYEYKDRVSLFWSMVLPSLMLIIIIFILFDLFSIDLSSEIFGFSNKQYHWLIIIICFISLIIRFFSLNLRMSERALAFSFLQISPKLLTILPILSLVLISGKFDFNQVLLISSGAYFITLLLGFIFNFSLFKFKSLVSINKKDVISLLALGSPLAIANVAYWGLTAIDKVILKDMSTYSELAIYSVSISFAGAAIILQSVFSTVWSPIVYKWVSEGKGEKEIEGVLDYLLIVVVVVFCLIAIASPLIKYFLPDEYSSVSKLLIICMATPVFYTVSEVTKMGISISRKTIYSMLITIVSFAFNFLLCIALIPIYGACGAAVSTSLSLFLFLVLRTEISCYLWCGLKRKKMYFYSLLLLFMSYLNFVYVDDYYLVINSLWGLILISVLAVNYKELYRLIVIYKFKRA